MAEGGKKPASYRWESLKSMPTKRVFATAVEVDNNIYVVGGCDQKGSPLNSFEVYYTEKREWKKLKPLPTKRASVAAVAVGKKIVVIGGVSESQTPMDAVEMYDIETKQWTQMESMKDGLLGVSAVVKDGKILVMGGMAASTDPKDFFMSFDITENRWQSLSPMPTPRYATFAFLIENKLYVIGGRQGKLPCLAFEVYDFDEEKWTSLPKIPTKRVFALYTTNQKQIFSLGGLNPRPNEGGFTNVCEVFNIETGVWTTGTPMPSKRGDFVASVLGDKVIACGGLGAEGKALNTAEAYDPVSNTWTQITNIPSAHCSCAYILTSQNKLHIIGGLSLNGPSGSMEALRFQ